MKLSNGQAENVKLQIYNLPDGLDSVPSLNLLCTVPLQVYNGQLFKYLYKMGHSLRNPINMI